MFTNNVFIIQRFSLSWRSRICPSGAIRWRSKWGGSGGLFDFSGDIESEPENILRDDHDSETEQLGDENNSGPMVSQNTDF